MADVSSCWSAPVAPAGRSLLIAAASPAASASAAALSPAAGGSLEVVPPAGLAALAAAEPYAAAYVLVEGLPLDAFRCAPCSAHQR